MVANSRERWGLSRSVAYSRNREALTLRPKFKKFHCHRVAGLPNFLYSKRTHRLNLHPEVDTCRRGRVQVGSAKSIDIRRVVVSLEGIS